MFSRRWLINYVLIVLILLFTYIGNRYDVEPGYQPPPPVTRINPAAVTAIDLQTTDETLRLMRTVDHWRLEVPIQWPANDTQVKRLLDIATASTASRLNAAEIELEKIGLDSPRALLRLDQTQILFGATNNIGERRYTMIDDEIFLLPDVHLPFILQGLIGVVDRRLIPPSMPLQSLQLPDLEFHRDDNNRWQVAGVSTSQTQQLIEHWHNLEATRVTTYNAAATPRQKLRAQLDDGTQLEFYLMSIEPEIVIAHPRLGLQYHFGADRYYQLISLRDDENAA